MRVLKFGGTSVGSAEKIQNVAEIINDGVPKIVVLSAMSGTTNFLEVIVKLLYKAKNEEAAEKISELKKQYEAVVEELFKTEEFKKKGKEMIDHHFNYMLSFTQDSFTIYEERALLAQGELISSAFLYFHLQERGVKTALIPALNFMRIDKSLEPDDFYIKQNLQREIDAHPGTELFVTQGYICRNAYGEIDNLKRGGSDYSASLIGAAIGSDEIQIWTDISGFHNNDPRFVKNTRSLKELSFDEAAELAYFGAKILHPSSVLPAKLANIPVRLKNTMKPEDEGTIIKDTFVQGEIKAVAAKDGITAIKIKSGRMLLAYGFLRKVFEIFERYKTPIDMITTSEIAVSVTIDDSTNLQDIVADLKKYANVEIDENQSIVCIVGNFLAEEKGVVAKALSALKDVPLRMVSYGGSLHNISVLVNTSDKVKALELLNENLFNL
ncbi:MAG: aspartate kinase [Chloroflexia bacterium]|nr:aspartate kinase [Chloroflexia bacterium]